MTPAYVRGRARDYSLPTVKTLFAEASACGWPGCGDPLMFRDWGPGRRRRRRGDRTLTGPAGPGAITSAKCHRLLRAICNTAVADGELPRNPCAIPGAGDEASVERPAVSVLLVYALADAVGPRWRALVLFAAFCGRRPKSDAGRRTVAISAASYVRG